MPVPWGDSGRTVRLTLEDGRILAARYLDTRDATAIATRLVDRSERFARCGVSVPTPMIVVDSPDAGVWVATPWLDGVTGASMLDDPDRCLELAAGMAALVGRVGNVDPTGLGLDGTWAEPGRLGRAAMTWIGAVEADLEPELAVSAREAAATIEAARSNAGTAADLAPRGGPW